MKSGSQTMTVAPAAAASSQQSTSVSARTRAARSRSPAPTMPPSPGMVAEITRKTTSLTACGTSEVRLYVATSAVPARAPRMMKSAPFMTCMTRFHSRNHQLSATNPRIAPRAGRAMPHHGTWRRTMWRNVTPDRTLPTIVAAASPTRPQPAQSVSAATAALTKRIAVERPSFR